MGNVLGPPLALRVPLLTGCITRSAAGTLIRATTVHETGLLQRWRSSLAVDMKDEQQP